MTSGRPTGAQERWTKADATAEAIAVRDRRFRDRPLDDGVLSRFPDVDDLFGVLWFVHRYTDAPAAVRRADALSALTIIGYLRAELDHRELVAIRTARMFRTPWSELAQAMRLKTRQSAEARWLRLRNALKIGGGKRSEVDARRDDALVDRPRIEPLPSALAELLVATVGALTRLARLLPEDLADDLAALRETESPAATLSRCRLLLAELGARGDADPRVVRIVAQAAPLLAR